MQHVCVCVCVCVQVPFIGWTGGVPLAGHTMQRVLQSVAKPFVSTFMKRTGQQFFMHDTEGRQPLLVGTPPLPLLHWHLLQAGLSPLSQSGMLQSLGPAKLFD